MICDEQKTKVIVDNLLSNAVKFSPSGGSIRIWVSMGDGAVQLDILDSGLGVDEADRDRVFDPFYQGRRVLDSHVRGTGLGLSIAREYALAHGGNIELVSGGDPGAHFRLTLPIRDTEGSS